MVSPLEIAPKTLSFGRSWTRGLRQGQPNWTRRFQSYAVRSDSSGACLAPFSLFFRRTRRQELDCNPESNWQLLGTVL